MTTLTIEPVTRIEGHGKVTIQFNNKGEIDDVKFHVLQFRGFEKFCEGRPFYEMPSLVERICGICPISHSIASAKACDEILGIRIPSTGTKLRRLLSCASYIQSHALSFFHLSSPDLVLGMDCDPAKRNIVGVMNANRPLAHGRHPAAQNRSANHRVVCRQESPSVLGSSRRCERAAQRRAPRPDDLSGARSIRNHPPNPELVQSGSG